MREILFRGKRCNNGEWVEGDSLVHSMYKKGDVCIGIVEGLEIYSVIPESISEFTGLTDKNGTKIFEGDILVDNPDNKICNMFEIAWIDNLAGFMLDDGLTVFNTFNYLENLNDNKLLLEVIGNIHDNPELIGGDS